MAARWGVRLIGVVSTVILARLLTPSDFGLMAMCAVFVGLLSVIFEMGVDTALIQNTSTTREHWDSAWTIRFVQGCIMAAALVVLSPFAAHLYGEDRVYQILPLLALSTVIAGTRNIGVVAFRKELKFHRDFQLTVSAKILSFVATMLFAYWWRDYHALVLGILVGEALTAALSYYMHPFRPKWSWSKAGEIWSFSNRMILINISCYINHSGQTAIVGALAGPKLTGLYSISDEIAHMPGAELIAPMSRAIVPGFAKLKHDQGRLVAAFQSVIGVVALFAMPAGIGLGIVAPDLIALMLGPQWHDAAPLVSILAASGMLMAIQGPAGNVLVVAGRLTAVALLHWAQTLLLIAFSYPVFSAFGLVGVALLQSALALFCLGIFIRETVRASLASYVGWFALLWRPVVASTVMYICCAGIYAAMGLGPAPMLVVIVVGAVVYVGTILCLWIASGRPKGPEQVAFDMSSAWLPPQLLRLVETKRSSLTDS